MRKHTVKRSLGAVMVALGLIAAGACGGGDGNDGARSSTTESATTESTTPPTTTLEEGVEADYLAAVAALGRVVTTTVDPNDPVLTEHFTDPSLGGIRTRLSTWQAEGKVWVTGNLTEHRLDESVLLKSDGSAVVTDCHISNDALVAVGVTNVEFPTPRTELTKTTMVRRGERWIVRQVDVPEGWDGVAGCAAE